MRTKKTGYMASYTNNNDRHEVGFDDGTDYELHCGDVFEIENVNGSWSVVRIEYDSDRGWYLVTENGNRDMPFNRTRIRMEW